MFMMSLNGHPSQEMIDATSPEELRNAEGSAVALLFEDIRQAAAQRGLYVTDIHVNPVAFSPEHVEHG